MRAGPMRQRVTLQQFTATRSPLGQEIPGWADVRTCWAKVEQLGGREAVNAKQIKAETTHRITLRWPGNAVGRIAGKMRFTFNGRVFNVTNPNLLLEIKREYQIDCTEVVNPP